MHQSVFAQNTQQQDSLATIRDSTKIDTIVIRWPLKKAEIVKIGVKKIQPQIKIAGAKTLIKKPPRFVPFSFWDQENQFGLSINEVAFVNWNAGGENSVSGLANLNFTRNYEIKRISWKNELRLRYGVNAQEGRELRKTDDFIRFSSTFGYRKDTITPWYVSIKLNFNTQFSNGFKYPNRDNPISRFMAPGYFFFGGGATYQPKDKKFNLYVSPLTLKATFVLDQTLADQGAFGVEKGNNIFNETGFLVTNTWEHEIFRNILLKNRLNVYTDYIKSFGNIDVDWEMNFNMKVNDYVSANVGTHIIYDDDIKFDEVIAEDGTVVNPGRPKLQLKQLLGVSFGYKF